MKILLIDNDRLAVTQITECLATQGYEVVPATTPKEAIQKLDTIKPIHLIVLDVHMDGQNGFEFLRFLKGLPRYCRIPVLICSSLSDSSVVVRSVELGASDFVAKPIIPETFLSKVSKAISASDGAVLIVDDDDFVRKLLQKVVEREGYRSLLASNGQEALTLLESNNVFIIISDIVMPGMSGVDLLKKVKGIYPSLPVVLISGHAGKISHEEAAKMADGYIAKPFKNVEISRKLQQFSRRRQGKSPVEEPTLSN